MTIRAAIMTFLACLTAAPALAATFDENGRCKDGCNYFAGDGEHIGAVEQYHLGPAKAHLAGGRANYAMEDIKFILRHFPNHPDALMLLDSAAKGLGQPTMPDKYFKAAIDAYPNEPMTYVVLGMLQQKRGNIGDAIARYQHALSLSPYLPDAHYNLGLALVKAKRLDEANAHAVAAYRLGHPMPGLRNQLVRAGAWHPDAVPAGLPAGKTDAEKPAEASATP
ncbi:MAG: tetratricopeptide repeat protein [Pseudomonadota bacterium]|jgi:tetratricopeptide (TPR) repeat protein